MRNKLRLLFQSLFALSLFSTSLAFAQISDELMQASLNAARKNDFSWSDKINPKNHVLAGYLQYHQLRYALPDVKPEIIQAFMKQYADSPISIWLLGQAQDAYGKANQYDDLLKVSSHVPDAPSRQCYYYSALYQHNPKLAIKEARELWLSEKSQPQSCDALFETLLANRAISDNDIWQRLLLAWRQNNSGLYRYLAKLIDHDQWQSRISTLNTLSVNPEGIEKINLQAFPHSELLLEAFFARWSRLKAYDALSTWQKINGNYSLEAATRQKIELMLARANLSSDSKALPWVKQTILKYQNVDLMISMIRQALIAQDWFEVDAWIKQLPLQTRQNSQWQYWQARAQIALKQPKNARLAFEQAAKTRDFYGFLASEHLKLALQLRNESPPMTSKQLNAIKAIPAIARIAALYRIDEPGLAYSEWRFLLKHHPHNHFASLAAYAKAQNWYMLAIEATIVGKLNNALILRFPIAYLDTFSQWAQQTDVSENLLLAIARRESAMNPYAQSPVGAMGLMQLMPDTARFIVRHNLNAGLKANALTDIYNNIGLGSNYFNYLLKRYHHNRIAAIAAYNAGPTRVDRWLANSDDLPFDLFIEQIPFNETRNYVQAILTYTIIYQHLRYPQKKIFEIVTDSEKRSFYGVNLLK